MEVLRVRYLVDDDVRAHWRRVLHRLAGEPVDHLVPDLEGELQVASGGVVEDGVASDVIQRVLGRDVTSRLTDHRGEFGLVIDLLGHARVIEIGSPWPTSVRWSFMKMSGRSGTAMSDSLGVGLVVEPAQNTVFSVVVGGK